MFIRKKKYEDLLDKLDEVSRENVMLKRELEAMKERKKVHNSGPTCNGCKNLIEEKHLYGTFYHCKLDGTFYHYKLDRGCKDYTEE